MSSAHHERKARNTFNSGGVLRPRPLKGSGSSVVLDALSCNLRLILKHSDSKFNENKKNIICYFYLYLLLINQNLEGARAYCAPSGSATVDYVEGSCW